MEDDTTLGPSFVGDIVDAVGGGMSGSSCNGTTNPRYWTTEPTAIFIVWDDWGGWYDDVVPPDCTTNPCTGYSNGSGNQYVYGFRVPLLVVGAYTNNFPNGYISGSPAQGGEVKPYIHDFGSILNFVEYAFGTGGTPLGGGNGIGGDYLYADTLAMDAPPTCNSCTYSLSDFFTFNSTNFHGFQTILGAKYGPSCFHTPNQTGCFKGTYPLDPDADVDETGTD